MTALKQQVLSNVLARIPEGLRTPLLQAFNQVVRNYRENRWEPASLNGGKLCEVVYCIIEGHLNGKMPSKPKKPSDFVASCRALEKIPSTGLVGERSARVQIPRILLAVYEIRNNRGVGHAGADVDPNHMDATFVLYAAKWILAELVRIFHNTSTGEAASIVDALVERVTPVVWEINGQRRILNTRLTLKEKTLVLAYDSVTGIDEPDLRKWLEAQRPSDFRKDVLRPLHAERLIEFDEVRGLVSISPKGIEFVEQRGLLEPAAA